MSDRHKMYIVVNNDFSTPRVFEHVIDALTWVAKRWSVTEFTANLSAFVNNESVEVSDGEYQLFTYEEFQEEIVTSAMLRLFNEVDSPDCQMLLQVHDAVVFEIRENKLDYRD